MEETESTDSTASPLRTVVWLLMGITGSTPGVLQLANEFLSFEAQGRGALTNGQLRQLEEKAGKTGLVDRLNNDEIIQIFDVSLTEITKVTFPWFYFGGGMNVTVGNAVYRFSFIRPQNTVLREESGSIEGAIQAVEAVSAIPGARSNGKIWRSALTI